MADGKKPSIRLSRDEAWQMIADSPTGIFTSLRRDGVPISMPLWFEALDERIYFTTRGKKLVRIANDPRSSFLVEAGERWVDLHAVHLTGRAQLITPSPELTARIEAEYERKYAALRFDRSNMPEATRTAYETAKGGVVEFIPDERILSWDNRRLGL